MNRRKPVRLLSLLMTVVLLFCIVACPAYASGEYLELFPETPRPESPQFTEETVSCISRENTLWGTLTIPDNVDGQMPVAILLHGLNTDRRWCDGIAWALAEQGIASVRFDFSGNGLSDGAEEDMTVASLTLDTRAIIDYVQSLEITDQDNIFLVAKSMGAVAALLASKSEGENIRAMCLWYPAFSLKSATQHGVFLGEQFIPWNPPRTLEVYGFTYGREFLQQLQIMDYESACREYEGDTLIIHGTLDPIIPMVSSIDAQELFQNCTFNAVPGGLHGFYGIQEEIAVNDTVNFIMERIA